MERIVGKNKEGLNRVFGIRDVVDWHTQLMHQGTQWYSKAEHGIQVSQMRYNKGKQFNAHRHKPYPRTADLTQECIIVLEGKIGYKIWDDQKNLIAEGELLPKQFLILFRGWHEFEILENHTLAIETKNGPYSGVEQDKEYMNDNQPV